jgi:septum formation protein
MNMSQFSIKLASNSPRRRQLLGWAGWPFSLAPVNIDETPVPGEAADRYVLRLAESKARASAAVNPAEDGQRVLFLAADTTVADGDKILGKPVDAEDARQILSGLRGRCHQVYTALAVFDPASGRIETDLCASDVYMRSYTDVEIEAYIASGDPFDKAGAYAIQNQAFHPVENFSNCFANIMGLPLCRLERLLVRFSLTRSANAQVVCAGDLRANCPVYLKII